MAKKRNIPKAISPLVWGYLASLQLQGARISSAYLFGSWAKGTEHRDSDIDLAIFSPDFTTWAKKTTLLARAKRHDFALIEAHGFANKSINDLSVPVIDEIKKEGIKIM